MTIEDEARVAAEERWPLMRRYDGDNEPDRDAPALRMGYLEGYVAGANRPTDETFDEGALAKVYGALEDVIGLDRQFVIDAINAMQNAGILFRERAPEPAPADERGQEVSVSTVGETETLDEREALIELIRDWAELHEPVRTEVAEKRVDAILASDVWRNRHPQTIPLYAMLDVWMALYGTSHPEFDEFYAEHGYAETWARLMHAVRHPQPTEGEPSGYPRCLNCGEYIVAGQLKAHYVGRGDVHQDCDHPYGAVADQGGER